VFAPCAKCGVRPSHPALGHLHGLVQDLCKPCSDYVVSKRIWLSCYAGGEGFPSILKRSDKIDDKASRAV
jgi:hypothetical protein